MHTTQKVLSIMNVLAREPAGVWEISKQLNIGKSTVSRTMAAVIGPELRLRTKSERLGSQVIRVAREISMELGASGGLY